MPECSVLKFCEVSLHMCKEMIYFINITTIKININVRASMSLNIHVITDQHYRINSDYSCPSSCPPLSTTLTLTTVLPLLFSIPDRRNARGFYTALQDVHVRGRSRWLGLRAGTADIKARRRPRQLGRWRHELHRCTRSHVQSCSSRDAHVTLTWNRNVLVPGPSWNGSNTRLA